MGSLVAAMMVTPFIWSALTTLSDSPHVGLPSAYSGEQAGRGGGAVSSQSSINLELLEYLQANTQDTEYLMAVKSSMQGSAYVIETGRPVLYMGGFNGGDPVVDAADLQQLVDEGRLRYIMWGGSQHGGSDIGSWVESTCTVVEVGPSTNNTTRPISTGTQNQDGPPGRRSGDGGTTLYQCGS
jgi:4-amino-4-deoxy-L-arabinose transferase-like glycosyltransferase